MMPLTLVDVDEDNIIKKIGGKPEVKKHLENLGKLGGNVIVNVKETRVAISNELAQKIMI